MESIKNQKAVRRSLNGVHKVATGPRDESPQLKRFAFLALPPEIRNEIYKWILPRPGNPKLICIDWMWNEHETRRIRGAERLYLGIYRTCKAINKECPSLEFLLKTGAIVPTVTVDALEFKHCWGGQWAPERVLKQILYSASHLRIRCDSLFSIIEDRLNLRAWKRSSEGYWMMGTFLGGSLPSPSTYSCIPTEGDDARKIADNKELGALPFEICNREKKILQVSTLIHSTYLSAFHEWCLENLLKVICHQELLENLAAVNLRMLGQKYEPVLFERLNRQANTWFLRLKDIVLRHLEEPDLAPRDHKASKLSPEEIARRKAEASVPGDEPEVYPQVIFEDEFYDNDDYHKDDNSNEEDCFDDDDCSCSEESSDDECSCSEEAGAEEASDKKDLPDVRDPSGERKVEGGEDEGSNGFPVMQ